jgi:hypothetical protein
MMKSFKTTLEEVNILLDEHSRTRYLVWCIHHMSCARLEQLARELLPQREQFAWGLVRDALAGRNDFLFDEWGDFDSDSLDYVERNIAEKTRSEAACGIAQAAIELLASLESGECSNRLHSFRPREMAEKLAWPRARYRAEQAIARLGPTAGKEERHRVWDMVFQTVAKAQKANFIQDLQKILDEEY